MASASQILKPSSKASRELARAQSTYIYRTREQNGISPVREAEFWPWWRIAGTNGLVLRREENLSPLSLRIRLPIDRIESRLLSLRGPPERDTKAHPDPPEHADRDSWRTQPGQRYTCGAHRFSMLHESR
jgi:hypothetical protein